MPIHKSLRDARDRFIVECEAALSENQSMVDDLESQEDFLESNQDKIDDLKAEIELLEDAIAAAEQLGE